jgi:opacity protein-like surface antigen
MRVKSWVLATTLILALPLPARAEWFVTPFFGGNFGGVAGDPVFPGATPSSDRMNWGVTSGWTGSGWLGFDADFGHAPKFFDDDFGFVTETSVLTLMGNARVAVPWGGMGKSVQPFVSGGAGLIRPNVAEAGELTAVKTNKFGWNVGGGLTGYFTDHIGVTGDVRYFRAMAEDEESPNAFGIDLSDFDFWRGAVGVSFKW